MSLITTKATYPKYPAYKDSGVEWLGEIPDHWKLLSNKHIFRLKKELVGKKSSDYTLLSLTLRGIIRRVLEDGGKFPAEFDTYQKVKQGDFVFCLFDVEETPRCIGLSNFDGMITGAYTVMSVSSEFNRRYLYYFYLNLDADKRMKPLYTGLRNTISKDTFFSFKTFLPPLPEKTAIANFLDDKCAKIDRAIAQKEKLIALLKERKQIVIQNAVTKGLDPEVKMKDSGVEWIGEVPAHWEVKRFRYVFNLSKGLTITKENLQDEGIPCVNYGEVHSKFGFEINPEIHKVKNVSKEYLDKSPTALLSKGDFVFADTSEDIEGSGNFTYLNSSQIAFAGYHTVIARLKIEVSSRFLAYCFDSISFRNQIRSRVKGVKVFSITQSILSEPFVWMPTLSEQEAIVNYLDLENSKYKRAITLQQSQIEKLREYKATLIDSAVTGKIRVSEEH
jgi:type I restriction enzyme S subunit